MKRLAIMAVTLAALAPWSVALAENKVEAKERAVDETKLTGDRPDVDIRNVSGSVRVLGWDRNEVRVQGIIGAGVEELVFDASQSAVKIRVRIPIQGGQDRKERADLTIHVPKGSSVEVNAVSALVRLEGIKGKSIDLESVSGSISVNNCSGELEAQSISGSLAVAGNFEGTELETVSGPIRASGKLGPVEVSSISGHILLEGAQEAVEAKSISGSIVIRAGRLDELDVETVNGSVRFDGMAGEDADFEIDSLRGSVHLTFDKEVSGEFDLRSRSGGIRCNFGPPEIRGRHVRGKRLEFAHGDGHARIAVETFSGDIAIHMKNVR